MKLYELSAEYQNTFNQLSEMDLSAEEFADNMAAIEADLEQKCLATAAHIKNLKAEAEAVKAAEQAMADRRRALENKVKFFTGYLSAHMPTTKLSNAQLVISKRKGVQSVVIDDPSKLPAQYVTVKQVESIDKKAIKADIDQLEGIAHLERGADTVVIK